MYIASFTKEALRITVHNLYRGLELISPVYFSNGTTCHIFPSRQTNASTIMETRFGMDSKQKYFKGALLYKLQRKYAIITDDQSDSSTTSIEDIATNMYFLIAWDIRDHNHIFRVCLIECIDDFIWDEDKLWTLCQKYSRRFYENYKSDRITWLIHGNAVMKTRFEVTYGLDYRLNIIIPEGERMKIISKGTRKYNMKEPMKIYPKKSVSPLLMLMVLQWVLARLEMMGYSGRGENESGS
jgi:hypothetical protein